MAEPRPVDAVLRRSRRIRRRRRSAGVVGAALLLAGVVAVRALALAPDPEPEPANPARPELCPRERDRADHAAGPNAPNDYFMHDLTMQPIAPAEVGDLVMLPDRLPESMTIRRAGGWRGEGRCPDASGVTWMLEGRDTMVSTLRAVAETLVLDAGSSPPADLPAEAVPPGWTVRWQAREALTSVPGARDDVTGWAVDVRGPAFSGCAIWVRRTTAADPPVVAGTSPGDRLTTVHGQEAVVYPGLQVRWEEPSGARVSVWCLLPALDDIVDLADSLAPVALDDPRIPPGGG